MSVGPERRCSISALAICLVLVAGCDTRPAARSLKDAETRITLRTDVPDTRMTSASGDSGTANALPDSRLTAAGEQSLFRETEVAVGKIEETRSLLGELGAREQGDRSIRFDLPADILFDFDKATLRPDAAAALEKALRLVANYPDAPLSVAGHSDAKGDDSYNDALSKRRADAVAGWLMARSDRSVTARGFGKRQPATPNTHPDGSDDPEGRQRNRRVEIIILPGRPAPSAPL